MNTQCVAYVADLEYLFPTILSAIQARKAAKPTTDILVLMSEPLAQFKELSTLLSAHGVVLMDAVEPLSHAFGRLDKSHFQARISVSTMAKLVLDQILPDHYSQIIYLDGDTQVVGSLAKLEEAEAPEGKFFAARDYTAIEDMLRIGKESHYFNAGFLKFNRKGWIGAEALDLFCKNPAACDGKHDQGALNYVCGNALILVSNRWNFPKQYLHMVDRSKLSVIHYMAHPKPWHGAYFPWGKADSVVYDDLRKQSPLFDSLYRGISLERKLLYKYRSLRQWLAHYTAGDTSDQVMKKLITGDYAV